MNAGHYPDLPEHRNPYDFVPLEGRPSLAQAPSLDRAHGLSGVLEIVLETLTPLLVNHDPSRPNTRQIFEFARLDGRPVVPATSLKGMLRSIHEIVTNSSMGLLKSTARGGWYRQRVPEGYVPTEGQLTPSETLFGIVGQGEDSVGYAGRLLIEDLLVTTLAIERVARPRGGMPKPEHESFYFHPSEQGPVLGRKLYYHQRDYRAVMDFYATRRGRAIEMREVETVPAGVRLTGRIRFLNLSSVELEDLVYTIMLEDGLAHKLGYGKPLGLGSVRLHITGLRVEAEENGIPARFLRYGPPPALDRTAEAPALRNAALRRWQARENGQVSYAAFAEIARWPRNELLIYPDYHFFEDERGQARKTTLQQVQRRATLYPGAAAPPMHAAQPHVSPANSKPSTPETWPPGPPIDLRVVGRLELTANGDVFVRGADDRRYLVTRESAVSAVLRALIDRLRAGQVARVKYRAERQRIEGKHQNVALDLEPAE